MKRDFDSLKFLVSPPCFILFRLAGKDNWLLASYVPDSCSVTDRMTYASSKGQLKSGLGEHYFSAELQLSAESELTYSGVEDVLTPTSEANKPYSAYELAHQKVVASENAERDWRSQQRSAPSSSSGTSVGSAHATSKIGGYHSVHIPLTASARQQISSLSSGAVELAIAGSPQESVEATAKPGATGIAGLKSAMNNGEPRFYLYVSGGSKYFVYSCPDNSPAKLRMVYSTAKPGLKQQIEQCGVRIAKTLEVRGADDISDDSFRSSVVQSSGYASHGRPSASAASQQQPSWVANAGRPSGRASSPAYGGQVRASNVSTSNAPHPVYNMIAAAQGGSPNRTTTKRIVIPPKAAW
jgi:twinfilin